MSEEENFDELAKYFVGLAKEYIKLWEKHHNLRNNNESSGSKLDKLVREIENKSRK